MCVRQKNNIHNEAIRGIGRGCHGTVSFSRNYNRNIIITVIIRAFTDTAD